MGNHDHGRLPPASHRRTSLEAEIERLIALLDGIDGDPDFEPDTDSEPDADSEPSLGWSATADGRTATGGDSDLELEDLAV